jgi:hypothetical protein
MAKKKARKITDQELADARLMVALEILDTDNASDIIDAMHHLVMLQSARSFYHYKKGGKGSKKQAEKWKHSADEMFTIVMCAIYQHQDATHGLPEDED